MIPPRHHTVYGIALLAVFPGLSVAPPPQQAGDKIQKYENQHTPEPVPPIMDRFHKQQNSRPDKTTNAHRASIQTVETPEIDEEILKTTRESFMLYSPSHTSSDSIRSIMIFRKPINGDGERTPVYGGLFDYSNMVFHVTSDSVSRNQDDTLSHALKPLQDELLEKSFQALKSFEKSQASNADMLETPTTKKVEDIESYGWDINKFEGPPMTYRQANEPDPSLLVHLAVQSARYLSFWSFAMLKEAKFNEGKEPILAPSSIQQDFSYYSYRKDWLKTFDSFVKDTPKLPDESAERLTKNLGLITSLNELAERELNKEKKEPIKKDTKKAKGKKQKKTTANEDATEPNHGDQRWTVMDEASEFLKQDDNAFEVHQNEYKETLSPNPSPEEIREYENWLRSALMLQLVASVKVVFENKSLIGLRSNIKTLARRLVDSIGSKTYEGASEKMLKQAGIVASVFQKQIDTKEGKSANQFMFNFEPIPSSRLMIS